MTTIDESPQHQNAAAPAATVFPTISVVPEDARTLEDLVHGKPLQPNQPMPTELEPAKPVLEQAKTSVGLRLRELLTRVFRFSPGLFTFLLGGLLVQEHKKRGPLDPSRRTWFERFVDLAAAGKFRMIMMSKITPRGLAAVCDLLEKLNVLGHLFTTVLPQKKVKDGDGGLISVEQLMAKHDAAMARLSASTKTPLPGFLHVVCVLAVGFDFLSGATFFAGVFNSPALLSLPSFLSVCFAGLFSLSVYSVLTVTGHRLAHEKSEDGDVVWSALTAVTKALLGVSLVVISVASTFVATRLHHEVIASGDTQSTALVVSSGTALLLAAINTVLLVVAAAASRDEEYVRRTRRTYARESRELERTRKQGRKTFAELQKTAARLEFAITRAISDGNAALGGADALRAAAAGASGAKGAYALDSGTTEAADTANAIPLDTTVLDYARDLVTRATTAPTWL